MSSKPQEDPRTHPATTPEEDAPEIVPGETDQPGSDAPEPDETEAPDETTSAEVESGDVAEHPTDPADNLE